MDKENLKEIEDLQSVDSNETVSDDSSYAQSLLSSLPSDINSDEETNKDSKPLQEEKQLSYETGEQYITINET